MSELPQTFPVHEGNGQWSFKLTATEMNGEVIGLVVVHASAIPAYVTIAPEARTWRL